MLMDQVWKHHLRREQARASFAADADVWAAHGGGPQQPIMAEMADEDEIQTVLVLFAAAEAALQSECERIATQATNTALGADLAALFHGAQATAAKMAWQQSNPQLAKILAALGTHGGAPIAPALNGFREIMRVRHWLAHGRHWTAPPMVDAAAAWASIRVLFDELGFPMPAQPACWL